MRSLVFFVTVFSLLFIAIVLSKRPEYIGSRDRFWRYHKTQKTLIVKGADHYSTINTCLNDYLTPQDLAQLSIVPNNRTVGEFILDNPDEPFGNIILVEVKNAILPIHVKLYSL